MGGRRRLLATETDAGIAVLDEHSKTETPTHLDREGEPVEAGAEDSDERKIGTRRNAQ